MRVEYPAHLAERVKTGRNAAIRRVADGMTRRHPTMAVMIDRAAALAADGGIHLTGTVATVAGSNGETWTLTPLRGRRWSCDCPSYRHGQYRTGDATVCKHVVALYIDFAVEGGF